ncbi:MAG: lysophospholipid acyltransferase family protein [Archangium sp.]
MAARKPSKPKKTSKPKAKKPSVLGNDPFARGSAVREVKHVPAPEAPRAAPNTPELQTKTRQPELRARKGSLTGKPPPAWAVDPQAHEHSPVAELLRVAEPLSHASSPVLVFEPTLHDGAPTAEPLRLTEPRFHASSPSLDVDPQHHAHSPTAHEPPAPPQVIEALAPVAEAALQTPQNVTVLDALKGLANAVRTASGLSSRSAQVDRYGKDTSLASSLRPLGELLYEKYWRVQVEGAEHLPNGPFIIVANHAGALPLDGPVLHLALRRHRPELPDARWLLEDQVFHAPFVGVLANRLGAVRANPENAVRLLEEGRPLIVFPEGFHGLSKPFSERYQLRRFGRGGYVKIALRQGVPIVPAAIVGGEESMPLLGKLPGGMFGVDYLPLTVPPLPARWHIRFAPPVSLEGAPSQPEADLAWVERTNHTVRDQIEGMLTNLLQHRDRVF